MHPGRRSAGKRAALIGGITIPKDYYVAMTETLTGGELSADPRLWLTNTVAKRSKPQRVGISYSRASGLKGKNPVSASIMVKQYLRKADLLAETIG